MAEEKGSGGFNVSLIKIDGKLSQPVTAFVNRIAEFFGLLNRPGQTVRDAMAQARADKIKAVSEVEVKDITSRAEERWRSEEVRKQRNMESIINQAGALIKDGAASEKIEDDWLAHFFEKSKIVSDKDMQSLWARLLAGEANVPGTFSKRTVEAVSILDKADASAFTQLCGFAWHVGVPNPIILNVSDLIYQEHGIGFSVLTHLDSIGLIRFEHLAGFISQGLLKHMPVFYFGRVHILELAKDTENKLDLGKVLFTRMGLQLAPISGATAYEGFESYVLEKWKAQGIKVLELPKPAAPPPPGHP